VTGELIFARLDGARAAELKVRISNRLGRLVDLNTGMTDRVGKTIACGEEALRVRA